MGPQGIFNPSTKIGAIYQTLTKARRWIPSAELAKIANIRKMRNVSSFVSDVRTELSVYKPGFKLAHRMDDMGTHYYRIYSPSGR